MIEARRLQRTFGEGLIEEEVADLWEDWMRHADEVLNDEKLIQTVYLALAKRAPRSQTFGRPGTTAEMVLRLLVLKHARGWSYDTVEREVRANLVYREFTRVGAGKVPDAKTLGRLGRTLGPEVVEKVHQRVVALAQENKIVQGKRLRVDTTVVETNTHHPTDSSLLGDGVRVLTRTMKKITDLAGDAGTRRGDAFDTRIVAGGPGYQSAAVTRSHDANALRIHIRLSGEKADGRANVRRLVGEVHLPADRPRADGEFALGVWRGLFVERHQAAVAASTRDLRSFQGRDQHRWPDWVPGQRCSGRPHARSFAAEDGASRPLGSHRGSSECRPRLAHASVARRSRVDRRRRSRLAQRYVRCPFYSETAGTDVGSLLHQELRNDCYSPANHRDSGWPAN